MNTEPTVAAFGEAYTRYAATTPAFFPRIGRNAADVRTVTIT